MPTITVDQDPLVWLRGPDVDATDDERAVWRAGALSVYTEAYELSGSKEARSQRDHLERVLTSFARWESPSQLRFLRLRHPTDEPVPTGVEFYDRQQREDLATQFPGSDLAEELLRPPSDREVVGETSVEEVAAAPGWSRLFYSLRGVDDAVYSFVRYVRHFEEADVLVVVRFGGDSPGTIVSVVPDADALAAAIDVRPDEQETPA